ncbi:hypothetical protein JW879_08505 [candidate division WOR-3 bacterium]|nr:hypothetical protein [candidate division WOR-3 bacterium]
MKIFMRNFCLGFVLVLLLFSSFDIFSWPNIPKIPKVPGVTDKIVDKIPGLDKILKSDPPITTNLKDAITEVSILDDYGPASLDFLWMGDLPRNEEGSFKLERPGLFEFTAQSYCLHAGTYSPGEGNGYLYAPLKGPQSDIVGNVLKNSYKHPEIEQRKVQVLLWAIIARTKLTDMSRENQLTASKLLTPGEMFELNGGALGLVPEDLKKEAFDKVPEEVRTVLEAEAKLRKKLTSIEAKYEDLERIAVLSGKVPMGKDSRKAPSGRWSYHEDGYFIRFFPMGYSKDKIQISIPPKITIKKDSKGRVISLSDDEGNLIEVEYNDVSSMKVNGDSKLEGYSFKKVRFVKMFTIPPEMVLDLETEWEGKGWVFRGKPSGKGSPLTTAKFPGVSARYKEASKYIEELKKLDKVLKFKGGVEDLMNLVHFKMAIKDLVVNNPVSNSIWATSHADMANKAIQYLITEKEGSYVWAFADGEEYYRKGAIKTFFSMLKSFISLPVYADESKIPWFNPNENVGTPGNTSRQRIGNSGRGALSDEEKKKACDQLKSEIKNEETVLDAYSDKGLLDAAKAKGYDGYEYNNCVRNAAEKAFSEGGYENYNDMSPAEQQNVLKQPPSGQQAGKSLESPMHTTFECVIVENWTTQDYINKFGQVAGKALQRAHRAHESFHQKTCKRETDYHEVPPGQGTGWPIDGEGYEDYMEDPDSYSQDEQGAYKDGINDKKKSLAELGC